ncbi:hypothetical protein BDW68DRAFT_159235 [Aspergillus falconensis]
MTPLCGSLVPLASGAGPTMIFVANVGGGRERAKESTLAIRPVGHVRCRLVMTFSCCKLQHCLLDDVRKLRVSGRERLIRRSWIVEFLDRGWRPFRGIDLESGEESALKFRNLRHTEEETGKPSDRDRELIRCGGLRQCKDVKIDISTCLVYTQVRKQERSSDEVCSCLEEDRVTRHGFLLTVYSIDFDMEMVETMCSRVLQCET